MESSVLSIERTERCHQLIEINLPQKRSLKERCMLHGVRLLFRHHKFCTRVQLVMHRNALPSTGRVATGLLVEALNPVWIAIY